VQCCLQGGFRLMNKLSRKDIADIVLNDTKQAREHF